jgi:alpha-glucoside transport system substrate-binding protein
MQFSTRRALASLGALAAISLVLSGCASGPSPSAAAPTAPGVVTIAGPLVGTDATLLEKSWQPWERANHIRIEYTGSGNFEEQIGGEAQQGNAPDLGIFQQPGLIRDLESRGYIQKLPSSMVASVKANFSANWIGDTTFAGVEYGAPLLADLNGWVFYSTKQFTALGLSVPKTWTQLIQMTDKIEQETGAPAWCEGFSANSDSGSAGTNWIEDLVLRQDGPAVYDKWVDHKIPFSDPRIKRAFADVSELLLSSRNANAGIGGVASIDTASTADVASALESGKCVLTHQTESFISQLTDPDGSPANVSPVGDYWAFMLPGMTAGFTPVTYGGDFVAALSTSADTVKVQQYLATTAWADSRVALGGATSPNIKVLPDAPSSLLSQQSTVTIQQLGRVFRFDASALMPSIVGSGTFLTGMVDWVNGTPTDKVLATIDKSWPTTN